VFLVFVAARELRAQVPSEWSLRLVGGESRASWKRQAEITALELEVAWPMSHRTDVALTLSPMRLWQPSSWFGHQYGDPDEQVRAVLGSIALRRHLSFGTPRIRPYVELGIGAMWSGRQVPAATSRFNVVTQPSVGVTLNPESTVPLTVGYRFLHISNGGYSPRNPGLGVNAIVLGVRIRTASWRRRSP
jgi:Lipid A 3-O-deacylase (PagL).